MARSARWSVFAFALASIAFGSASQALAWGKNGHSIVCQTAAYLVASEPKAEFLKNHGYDLGYYCNVPDLVWKSPATYGVEWTNHFMDMEIFDRNFQKPATEKTQPEEAFKMDRLAFNAKFPDVKDEAGRAFWRIRELETELGKTAETLMKKDLTKEARHKAQADWLVLAGVIGHYVGDLAQPLHVTENYDGQMSEQKGIHSFYEEALVDELFFSKSGANLTDRVQRLAAAKWPVYRKQAEKKSTQQLMEDLAKASNKALAGVLKTDKKIGRKDIKKAAQAHRGSIVEQLAAGALAQAELYRRHIGWDYNGDRFFTFVSAPAFVAPPQATPSTSPTPAAK